MTTLKTDIASSVSIMRTLRRRTEWRAIALFVGVAIVLVIVEPETFQSYGVTLSQIALYGLIALGLTPVILQGELDLSVGSVLALSGAVFASNHNVILGLIYGLGVGVAVGIVNATLVAVVRVNSFIATLGTMFAVSGLAFVVTGGKPIAVHDQLASIQFGQSVLGQLTPRVLIFFAVFALIQIFLTRTRVGREFYAVGGNRQAAIDAGIPVRRRLYASFILCAIVAALGGIVNTFELTSADPTAGSNALLNAIAAAVIGGIVLTGGRGSLVGTLIGAAALGMLETGLDLSGASDAVTEITIGLVLVVAVVADVDNLQFVLRGIRSAVVARRI